MSQEVEPLWTWAETNAGLLSFSALIVSLLAFIGASCVALLEAKRAFKAEQKNSDKIKNIYLVIINLLERVIAHIDEYLKSDTDLMQNKETILTSYKLFSNGLDSLMISSSEDPTLIEMIFSINALLKADIFRGANVINRQSALRLKDSFLESLIEIRKIDLIKNYYGVDN